jgi:hypothetical protein
VNPLLEAMIEVANRHGLDLETFRAIVTPEWVATQTLHVIMEVNLRASPEAFRQRVLQADLDPALGGITWVELGSCLVVYWHLSGRRWWPRTRKDLRTKAELLRRVKLEFPGWDESNARHRDVMRIMRAGDTKPPLSVFDPLPAVGGFTVAEHCELLRGVSPFEALAGGVLPFIYERVTGKAATAGHDTAKEGDSEDPVYCGGYVKFARAVLLEAGIRDTRASRNTPYADGSIARVLPRVQKLYETV